MNHLTEHYINGQWSAPLHSNPFDVINPADESVVGAISLGSVEDMEMAIQAAHVAFADFSEQPLASRIALLEKLLSVYDRRVEEMAQAISVEMGAPIDMARREQAACGRVHIKATIDALKSFSFECPIGPAGDRLFYEPIGVAGLITPWNWPMNQITLKVAPALGVGCTVVLKPSEIAPLSAHLFTEMIDEAGFPAGVFNLVDGDGPTVGAHLSAHPLVDMVSFTGSTRGGVSVAKNAADTVKRVSQELGGKSPNLIFASADLEKAVSVGVQQCFHNTGQSCNAPTRMFVERVVYDEALNIAKTVAEMTVVDKPSNEGDHMGPLVSQAQWDKVQSLITGALDEGSRLLTGGPGRPDGFNSGYYVRPTVFADVDNQDLIAREEVFGPVLAIIPFDTEEQAIAEANDTPYGLAAYLSTGDDVQAVRVARRLRAGNVHVNGTDLAAGSPFGGYKQSGNGREKGSFGLHEFLEIKAVSGCSVA